MATPTELKKLLGRASAEKGFRNKLVANPVSAAKEMGITLTSAQASNIRGAKNAITVGGKTNDIRFKEAAAALVAGIWI